MNRTSRNVESDEADSTYTKAAKAELGKKFDTAFRLYIKSAEIFLHLSRSADEDEKLKLRWKGRASQALERAEKIKSVVSTKHVTPSSSAPTPGSSSANTLAPVAVDHFSHREQSYVLQRGSLVNGLKFALWDDTLDPAELNATEFQDPDGQPSLSPEQKDVGTVWRRPEDTGSSSNMPEIRARDIVQHTVTDCSVCASVSVCLEHSRRFKCMFLHDALHYDFATGRCDVKILFNGSWRRIVIDDKLPHHPTTGVLMCMTCHSQLSPSPLAWPSHIEKAYMKLMGGYDFPGSNSSIDLHALRGWIPEQLETRRVYFERESTWARIYDGFRRGHCMLTLGTGQQSKVRWGSTRLLPSHSYAVIDVDDDEKDRILTVLDSWVPIAQHHEEESRILQIPWTDVLATFEGIYLSWDPQLWKHTLSFHGTWSKSETASGSTHRTRARFCLNDISLESTEVLVLLTRHVLDTRDTSHFIALNVQIEDDTTTEFVSSSHLLEDCQGVYTNSAHVLVKCRISRSQSEGLLNIIASYDGESKSTGFTLTIYAMSEVDIAWEKGVITPPFSSQIEDKFTQKTAGGNPEYPTFMFNPQYLLRIHGLPRSKARTSLMLETQKDLPVNISILWSQGERVFDLSEKDMVATSGPYRYGLGRVMTQLAPGEYNVVVSALEPLKTGLFRLSVECSNKFDLNKIPQEGAGMYSKSVRGLWDGPNAVGGPSFKQYLRNPIYEMDCRSPTTQVKVRLQLINPGSSSPLNVTIYSANVTDPDTTTHVTTSGGYHDAISGVVTPLVSLARGKYWIVPSTYSPGVQASFLLIVYSSVLNLSVDLVDQPR